ncbi:MAG: AraC family transcriptional regulator [Verrucomicrobia bacterium]|nr:AraC family transcriptional regulator [Cytophagales bacterium]
MSDFSPIHAIAKEIKRYQLYLMIYQEFLPTPALQPYVHRFWILENEPSDSYPMEHIVTPNGMEALILSYRQVNYSFMMNGKIISLPEAYLFIPSVSFSIITTGCSGFIGILFKSGSLHKLLKNPMTELIGQAVEPQAFLGSQPIRSLLEKLPESTFALRVAYVEDFLSQYFCMGACLTTIQYATQLIRQSIGMKPVEQIAEQVGVSRRAIEKQFMEKVGLSPKYYSRMVRFSAVQRFLMNHPQSSWLDLTHQFGYYDQSHLIKDFYDFTGSSPQEFAAMDTILAQRYSLQETGSDSF